MHAIIFDLIVENIFLSKQTVNIHSKGGIVSNDLLTDHISFHFVGMSLNIYINIFKTVLKSDFPFLIAVSAHCCTRS